jgi:hypothetical protein
MKLSKHFFFYATLATVIILGPLYIWNPNALMCDNEKQQFAREAFAEEASWLSKETKSSKWIFGSNLCILGASLAPLADALFDLWCYCRGMMSEKSPYTWNAGGTASAMYLAERLSVILMFGAMTSLGLVVTSSDSNYDPMVIYNALHGGSMTSFTLTGGLYVSILHFSAESVVTDTVASFAFAICNVCGIVYYWGCNPIAASCAYALVIMISIYLFGLVCHDYFVDNGDENMQKSYQKAVSLTYAIVYCSYIVVLVVAVASLSSSFLVYPVARFLNAAYISIACTYLASPKWREELFQTVRMRKNMRDMEDSRRFHVDLQRRSEAMAALTMGTSSAKTVRQQSTSDSFDDTIEGGSQSKPTPK